MDTRFKSDSKAVSPVIGVILMVAITVILAATIGSFVVTTASNFERTSPLASFAFSIQDGGNTIEVVHDGGDSIPTEELIVIVNGVADESLTDSNGATNLVEDAPDSISPGDTFTVDDSLNGDDDFGTGDTVRIVWVSPDTQETAVIGEVKI